MTFNIKDLSTLQERVYRVLARNPGRDHSIHKLYLASFAGTELIPPTDNRTEQQKLGPLISRINTKIYPSRIVPGRTKQTYKLKKA